MSSSDGYEYFSSVTFFRAYIFYNCALKLSILLSSEVSLTKGRHFEMFLATFDISIFTHGYESIWLNSNIVLFRNLP